jgi:hypothetical protein
VADVILLDWALILFVMACVIAIFFCIGKIVDECIALWKERDET